MAKLTSNVPIHLPATPGTGPLTLYPGDEIPEYALELLGSDLRGGEPEPAPTSPASSGTAPQVRTEDQLRSMENDELRGLLDQYAASYPARARKDELVALVLEAQKIHITDATGPDNTGQPGAGTAPSGE